MDVGQTVFETTHKIVTLLDAPGHRDFIPNMIKGAAQADVGILVINATTGEFETGFAAGGQTREHVLLSRSLGVLQLIVVVNKMDTVEWSKERYDMIVQSLTPFLKMAGYPLKDVTFVPASGFTGDNLKLVPSSKNASWITGPCLLDVIDTLSVAARDLDASFRLAVSNVYKGSTNGLVVCGRVLVGSAQINEDIVVSPGNVACTIKALDIEGSSPRDFVLAGDTIAMTILGLEPAQISIGSVVCGMDQPISTPVAIGAQIAVFEPEIPITIGHRVIFHSQQGDCAAIITKLLCLKDRSTGEVTKTNPRVLPKHSSAMVEISFDKPVCLELYRCCKDLGRFMLRNEGCTVAVGIVTSIL